jgi:hypothetical protein
MPAGNALIQPIARDFADGDAGVAGALQDLGQPVVGPKAGRQP